MDLFLSGEVFSDIAEDFRIALVEVESNLKQLFASRYYGDDLKSLAVIPVILPEKMKQDFPEIKKFKKKKKELELRLWVNYQEFKGAKLKEKCGMIVEAVIRGVSGFASYGLKDFDFGKFQDDVKILASGQGWILAS